MKGLTMIQSRDLEVPMSMVGPFNAIRHDRQGIGYTFQYYDTYMTRIPEVRIIAINGIRPTAERIGKRAYPLLQRCSLRGWMICQLRVLRKSFVTFLCPRRASASWRRVAMSPSNNRSNMPFQRMRYTRH